MASPVLYPLVNGFRYAFASIEAMFIQAAAVGTGGLTGTTAGGAMALNFRGFKSINYKRTRSRAKVRGNHPDPIAKTRGDNDYTGDVEVLLAEFNLLQAQLQAIQAGYGDVFFQFNVTYTEAGADTIVDTLIGCTLDSTESSNSQGTEASMRKLDINPLKVYFNGIDDLGNPLAALPT